MTVPARRKSDNHRKSINKWLKEQFGDVHSVSIVFQDSLYDVKSLDSWLAVSFLQEGAGRKDMTLVQLDLYSRVRGKITAGDRYGQKVATMADQLHAAMHVDSIQVYDFAVPTNPVLITGAKLMVQNSRGTFREPDSDRVLGFEDGVARRSLTYRLRMVEDASQASSYYD